MTNIILTLLLIGTTTAALAHTNYGGATRDFGIFQPGIIGQSSTKISTVTTDFGWANGTDADFGDAHHIRAFRFSLLNGGVITITALASDNGGAALGGLFPAFSLYSGLLHTSGGSDTDTAPVTLAYLASLGIPQPREGAFDALHALKIGNDAGDLSTLAYIGNAADGTSLNFGSIPGIYGDGLSDGFVSASFTLDAGDYSLLVGGAEYAGTDSTGNYGINVNLSVVPEPSIYSLVIFAASIIWILGRKKICRHGYEYRYSS